MEQRPSNNRLGTPSPVFVAGGHRRAHAVRLAAATLGLLLAGWLAALAASLVGFSPLPELTLSRHRRAPGAARGGAGAGGAGGGGARRRPPRLVDRLASRAGRPPGKRDAPAGAGSVAGASGGRKRGRRRTVRNRQRHWIDVAGQRRREPAGGAPRRHRPPPATRRRSRRPPAARRAPARRGATPPPRREGRSPPIRPAAQGVQIQADAPANASPVRWIMASLGRARSESARRVGRRIERPPAHWSLLALLLGGLLLLLAAQGLSTVGHGAERDRNDGV